jgi:hypothetical protein
MISSLLVILLQIGAGSPLAEKPAPAVTITATPQEIMPGTQGDKDDVLHCKIIPTTGTRFGSKLCVSEAEARMTAQEAKRTLERMQGAKTLPVN